jgi:hypothetical protein
MTIPIINQATKAGTYLDSSYDGNLVLNLTGRAGKFNWDESKAYAMAIAWYGADDGVGMYLMNKTTSHLSLLWFNNTIKSISDGDKYFDVLVWANDSGVMFINGTTGRVFNSYSTGEHTTFAQFINNWQNVIVIRDTTYRYPFTKNVWLFDKYGNLLDTDSFYIDGFTNYIVTYNNPSHDTFSMCFQYGYKKCVSYRISGSHLIKTYEGDPVSELEYYTALFNDGHYVFLTTTRGEIYIFNRTLDNPILNFSTNTSRIDPVWGVVWSYPFNILASDFGEYYRIAVITRGDYPNDYGITYNWYPSNNTVVLIDKVQLDQRIYVGDQGLWFVTPRTFYIDFLCQDELYIPLNGSIVPAPQIMSVQVSRSGNRIHMKDVISSDEEAHYLFNDNLNRVGNQAYTYCFCNCTDYTGGDCYNTTHSIYTRNCHPDGCYEETKFILNSSCIPAPPPPPIENIFFNKYMMTTVIIFGIAIAIALLVGDDKLTVFLSTVSALIFMGAIIGLYPKWVIIIAIIGAGGIFAKFITGLIRGE